MSHRTVNAKQLWKAQSSAHRAYLRRIRLERLQCDYVDNPGWAAKQLQRIPYVSAPPGFGRPHPPMYGFGLDRFRVGMALNVWLRAHAARLGVRFQPSPRGEISDREFLAYLARLYNALANHLAKHSAPAPRRAALRIAA
jgi:hypothetical protein